MSVSDKVSAAISKHGALLYEHCPLDGLVIIATWQDENGETQVGVEGRGNSMACKAIVDYAKEEYSPDSEMIFISEDSDEEEDDL